MSAEGNAVWGQTLALVALFIAALAALPWLIRRLQQRGLVRQGGAAAADLRVLSGVAVGAQQRVVTVEVGVAGQRTVLVLGVTAQQVSCLHVLPAPSFADAMSGQQQPPQMQQAAQAQGVSASLV